MHFIIPRLILSHRLETLAYSLHETVMHHREEHPAQLFQEIIFVPHEDMKQWLLRTLAQFSTHQAILGLRILPLSHASHFKYFCQIYAALGNTKEPGLLHYFTGDTQQKKQVHLSEELASLWASLEEWGDSCQKLPPWHTSLRDCVTPQTWDQRLPYIQPSASIHLFGIDPLPKALWECIALLPFKKNVYLFSPCQMFWSDLSTDRDKRALKRYWHKKNISLPLRNELSSYLKQEHPLLSNWGKVGRTTLKLFENHDIDIEERYDERAEDSLLTRLQKQILCLEEEPVSTGMHDPSLQLIPAGVSRLRELELLKEKLLCLFHSSPCSFSEVRVLAPDLSLYAPLIPLVFGHAQTPIPYALTGIDQTDQSSFLQGIKQLLTLVETRWDVTAVLSLLHNRSFLEKKQLSSTEALRLTRWIEETHIRFDLTGSPHAWESGLVHLLERVVFSQEKEGIEGPDIDLLELLVEMMETLPPFLMELTKPRPLRQWAHQLRSLHETYLESPPEPLEEEALTSFSHFLCRLEHEPTEELFSCGALQHLLDKECRIHSRCTILNAIQFAPLRKGSVLPAQIFCLLGMEEDAFPRKSPPSSLCKMTLAPPSEEEDRYLFLQVLFAARKNLLVSYLDRSEEGHPLNPSLVVQELLSYARFSAEEFRAHATSPTLPLPKIPPFHFRSVPTPDSITVHSLSLLTRNPLKFYVQKGLGLSLPPLPQSLWKDFEYSALDRYLFRHSQLSQESKTLHKPLGLFGVLSQQQEQAEWHTICTTLNAWDVHIEEFSPLSFNEAPLLVPMSSGLTLEIRGEIPRVSSHALLHLGDDSLPSLLTIWPEILLARKRNNISHLFCLKNGVKKEIHSILPDEALPLLINYYLRSLERPSPLSPEWAEALLQQDVNKFRKKMETRRLFHDPATSWIEAKLPWPDADRLFAEWDPLLRGTFQSLITVCSTHAF